MIEQTVGSGGDYANLAAVATALGTSLLADDRRFTLISSILEPAGCLIQPNVNGHTIIFDSTNPSRGDPTKGWEIDVNGSGVVAFLPSGSGKIIVKDLRVKASVSGNYMLLSLRSNGPDTEFTDIVVDAGARNGSFTELVEFEAGPSASASTDLMAKNLTIFGSASTGSQPGLSIDKGGYAGSIIAENVTVRGPFSNGINCNSRAQVLRNCVCSGTLNNDYSGINASTGVNNASEDATAADGNWASGTGNITGITPADDYLSLDETESDFLQVKAGGSLAAGGVAPAIANNLVGSRGNRRPQTNGDYSIGASELVSDTRPGIQGSQVQIDVSQYSGSGNLPITVRNVNDLAKAVDGMSTGGAVVETIISPSDDIKTIIEAASAGDSFLLASGVHTPSNQISLSGKTKISIRGLPGAVIDQNLTVNVFLLASCEDIVFDGFRIETYKSDSDATAFSITNGDIKRVTIKNIHYVPDTGRRNNLVGHSGASSSAYIENMTIENCICEGATQAVVLFYSNNANGVKNLVVKGCTVNSSYSISYGIDVHSVGAGRIKGLRFINNYLTGSVRYGVNLDDADGAVIQGNVLDDVGAGTSDYGVKIGSSSTGCVVDGNTFLTQYGECIYTLAPRTIISNNIIKTTNDNAIYITASDCTVTGNTFTGVANVAVYVDASSPRCVVSNNNISSASTGIDCLAVDVVIEGNSIYNSGAYGILARGDNSVVRSNRVDTAGNTCIWVGTAGTSADNCVIDGNVVSGSAADGIHLEDVTESVINNNRCYGNTGSGIEEVSNCDYNLFDGNHLRGNTGANFVQSGTNATLGTNVTA